MSRNEAPQLNHDSLERQQSILHDIKAEHARVLNDKLIIAKALEVAPELNSGRVLEIAVTCRPTEVEGETETGIMFFSIAQGPNSEFAIEECFIPVARWTSTNVMLQHDYTQDDFKVVDDLAFELIHMRDAGELDLSDDLLSIKEPRPHVFDFNNLDS